MFRINISLYGDEIDMLIIKWFLRTLWGTLCYNAYSDQDSYTFLGIMNNSSMPKEKELSLQDRGRPARSSVLWFLSFPPAGCRSAGAEKSCCVKPLTHVLSLWGSPDILASSLSLKATPFPWGNDNHSQQLQGNEALSNLWVGGKTNL